MLRPGRLVIVDLRDELVEKDEALGLFVILPQMFAETTYEGQSFNLGFPISPWYRTYWIIRRALILLGSDARNPSTEETLTVEQRVSCSRHDAPDRRYDAQGQRAKRRRMR